MTERIVHVVDDEAAVRSSLAFLLMTSGFAVRTHDSGQGFLDSAGDPRTACLVTDLRMPEMDGVDLLNAVRARGWHIPSVVITGHGDVPMAVAAMKAGASDFIEKPFEDQDLIDAIRRACSQAQAYESLDSGSDRVRARLDHLTAREHDVLKGIAAGLPNKTIALHLNISPRTVEIHRANIMTKMQARTLADLIRMTLSAEGAGG